MKFYQRYVRHAGLLRVGYTKINNWHYHHHHPIRNFFTTKRKLFLAILTYQKYQKTAHETTPRRKIGVKIFPLIIFISVSQWWVIDLVALSRYRLQFWYTIGGASYISIFFCFVGGANIMNGADYVPLNFFCHAIDLSTFLYTRCNLCKLLSSASSHLLLMNCLASHKKMYRANGFFLFDFFYKYIK